MTRRALAVLAASLSAMTPTPQANDFPSGGIFAVGSTSTLTLNPGQAFDNNYTVHFYVTASINGSSTTYGTASVVVAIETNDGSGWVERAAPGYNCGYLSGPPPWSARTCTWPSEQVTISVVGLGLNSSLRLRIKSFSVSNNAGGSFGVYGGDGTGSNPGTFNGVNYSYDPAPPPTYTVAVTPDGGSQTAYVSSTGNVATFSVQNQGNQDGVVYDLSVVGCTAPLTNCTSDAPSVTVNHAATVNATVHFDMQGTLGTGTITLRATHSASGATNDGTINVSALSAAVAVGPDPGSQSVGANMTGNVATFTVQNNGNQGTLTYALSVVTCGAPLINCTSDLGSVNVGQGATVNATVHFDATGTTGTGAIVLRATHTASGTIDDGTINVTVNPPTYAVQVGPDPGSQGALMGSTGNVATFTVQNQGNQGTLTYGLSVVTCGAPLTNCTSDAGSVIVGQGSTGNATVHFDVQNIAGTGAIVLRATHAGSGATNDGTINATATTGRSNDFTAGNSIAAVGQTATATLNPGSANSGLYTVHYFATVTINGNSSTYGTASLSGVIESNDGSGNWVQRGTFGYNCGYPSGPPPYSTTTCSWAHDQQTITAPGLGINAQIRLRATSLTTNNGSGASFVVRGGDGAGSNPETYNGVTYATDVPVSYAVEVGPDPGSQAAFTSQTGLVATFTVQNNGNQGTLRYQLSVPTCTTPPLANCAADVGFVDVGQGLSVNATVRFNTQSTAGSGPIVLRATHAASGTNNDGTINVTVTVPPSYAVAVTPDGGTQSTSGGTTGNVATFAVQNNGNQGMLTYALSVVGCPAPLTNCTTDLPSVSVAQGASQPATLHFDAQNSTGSGTITFRATHTASGTSNDGTIAVSVVSLSSVSSGVFTVDSRFLLVETANSYNAAGQVTQVTDPRGGVANFLYGGNVNNAFLTKVTRVRDATGSIDLVTDIKYLNGRVDTIIDEGRARRSFTYDAYGRLRRVANSGNVVVHAYGYVFSRTSANGWVFQAASPNSIIDSAFVQQTPSVVAVVSTGYFDGLGRPIQTVVPDGTNYHVTAAQYDLKGRAWRVWNSYRRPSAGYDAAFTTTATDSANLYYSTTAAKPYLELQYRPDPLDRVSRVIPQYVGASPTIWSTTAYGVNPGANYLVAEITDEAGKKTQRSTDVFANVMQSTLGYGVPSDAAVTQFAYDVRGHLLQITDPRGLVTSYGVDTRGLLISRSNPDVGLVRTQYDRGANPRFMQDANQAAAGKVSFKNYDFAGRPLNSGTATASFPITNPDATQSFETTQGNWLVVRAYDAKPSTTAFPWNQFSSQISPLTLSNVSGRLAAVASKSNGAWQVNLFSYSADGQMATRYIYTQANSGTSVLTAVNTTVTYTWDLRGAVTKRALSIGTKTFNQWYDYDARGVLTKTYAATNSNKPAAADLTRTYRPAGTPENYQFTGGLSVPIRYTIRDQVERIGDPTGTSYPFSARYAYLPNGVVDTAEFYSGGSIATLKRYRYAFGAGAYDALNRLKSADFSSWNTSTSAWTVTPNYDLSNISYDRAGNLLTLQRNRETGTLIDNLSYSIPGTSNRLTSLIDAVPTTAETWDAESGDFTYDANGNLLTATGSPYSITAVSYDPSNLPLSITRTGTTTNYRYDGEGQRITKQVGTGNVEVYLREGSATIAVFTLNTSGSLTSWYFNLLWQSQVIGRQPGSGSRSYYHADALGSTRAVTQGATVTESYDFDPWGLLMPGRTRAGATKEGFSGKEQDTESGLDYFGARYYMPALGRWTTADPLADGNAGWTPYNYALNNPLLFTDPTGRRQCRVSERDGYGSSDREVNCPDLVANMSPIYDPNGNLIGTDDEGLQGEPIVMDPKDFKQGMSHTEAMSKNKGRAGLASPEAEARFEASYQNLKNRPDWDGQLTYMEAIYWFNHGGGQPLYVDARTLDLSKAGLTVSQVANDADHIFNLFSLTRRHDETGDVFGRIKIVLIDAQTGEVRLGNSKTNLLDRYDFGRFSPFGVWAKLRPGSESSGTAKEFIIFCTVCTNHVALDKKK